MEVNLVLDRDPSHPGKLLDRVLLRNYGMTIDELAEKSGIESHTLNKIILGTQSIDRNVVDKLHPLFGGAAQSLYRLQKTYDFFQFNNRKPTGEELEALMVKSNDQLDT